MSNLLLIKMSLACGSLNIISCWICSQEGNLLWSRFDLVLWGLSETLLARCNDQFHYRHSSIYYEFYIYVYRTKISSKTHVVSWYTGQNISKLTQLSYWPQYIFIFHTIPIRSHCPLWHVQIKSRYKRKPDANTVQHLPTHSRSGYDQSLSLAWQAHSSHIFPKC